MELRALIAAGGAEASWVTHLGRCKRLHLSPGRRPSRSTGGPGGGGAQSLPAGRGRVASRATRAGPRHALADATGCHRHRTPEPAAAGPSRQQVGRRLVSKVATESGD